jgi:hypothetical protein
VLSEVLEFLYQALGSEFGISVSTDNTALAQQRFSQARAKAGDPELDQLIIRRSPFEPLTKIWIMKGKPK